MNLLKKVSEINQEIQKLPWCDFQIIKFDGYGLNIVCGIDLSQKHNFEIIFKDVFIIISNTEWKTDTSQTVIELVIEKEAMEINIKYQIEMGFNIFKFYPEGYENGFGFYIVAKELEILSNSPLSPNVSKKQK